MSLSLGDILNNTNRLPYTESDKDMVALCIINARKKGFDVMACPAISNEEQGSYFDDGIITLRADSYNLDPCT